MSIKLPAWLAKHTLSLPSWAKVIKGSDKVSITIQADTDGYVKEWLNLLNVKKIDQYWLEVAYQCAKMDLQNAIAGTQFDPRVAKKSAEFKFTRSTKWALVNYPPGKGIKAASQGREAREHYRTIRGNLPF